MGDDLLTAAPGKSLTATGVAITVSGPAVYLLGEVLFRLRMVGRLSGKRVLAVAALAVLGVAGRDLSALVLSGIVAGILVALAMWEYEQAHGSLRPRRGPASVAKR